jgi:hypothetical protein
MKPYATLSCFAVTTSKTSTALCVVSVIAGVVGVVSIYWPVVCFTLGFNDVRLMVIENNVSHALEGHLNSFALLEHVIHLFESRHRLWSHADPLIVIRTQSISLREISNASRTIGHLYTS